MKGAKILKGYARILDNPCWTGLEFETTNLFLSTPQMPSWLMSKFGVQDESSSDLFDWVKLFSWSWISSASIGLWL